MAKNGFRKQLISFTPYASIRKNEIENTLEAFSGAISDTATIHFRPWFAQCFSVVNSVHCNHLFRTNC